MRYFIELSYFGKNYHGWQKQPDATSVQQTVENALSTVLRTKLEIVGAGRTDAGVHAKQLFAHFDFKQPIEIKQLIHKLNSFLPYDIAIKNIFCVNSSAHARFDATSRSYEYHISLEKNPFEKDFSYYLKQKPDIKLMNSAAKILFDYEDFECFSKTKTDVYTYNCTLFDAEWTLLNNKLIFYITANRFLRNMVRAIVGTLLDVGLQKISLNDFHEIIKQKNRSLAGVSVPAQGLYLTKITYPDSTFIAYEHK